MASDDDKAKQGSERTPPSPADEALRTRLNALERRLEATGRGKPLPKDRDATPTDRSGLGQAFRLSTEFTAGIIAGGGIGWVIDQAVGSKPWGLIVFLMLGFGAGVFNVARAAGMLKPRRPPGDGR